MGNEFMSPDDFGYNEKRKGILSLVAPELLVDQLVNLEARVKKLEAENTRLEVKNAELRHHLNPAPTPEDGKEDW